MIVRWICFEHGHPPTFPHLSIDVVPRITIWCTSDIIRSAYVQDKLDHDGIEDFHYDTNFEQPRLLRILGYSNFQNITRYHLWISFSFNDDTGESRDQNYAAYDEADEGPVLGYYYCVSCHQRVTVSILTRWYFPYSCISGIHYFCVFNLFQVSGLCSTWYFCRVS